MNLPEPIPLQRPTRLHARSTLRPGFLASFRHAWEGVVHTVVHQRNMRVHLVAAVMVGLVGSGIRLGLAEKVTLIFCVLMVFFAEILNSALEALVDLHTEDFHDLAKTTKDAAAAGVLVLGGGTVVIFAAILVHNWDSVTESGAQIARQVGAGVPLVLATAALLSGGPRPAWVDHLLFAGAVALWGALWTWTASAVFTTLTGVLVWLAWRSALRMHAKSRLSALGFRLSEER